MSKTYKLQRWWITKGWTTIETSKFKDKIMSSYRGYCKQIIDGTFRVRSGKKNVAQRLGSLYKKRKGKTYGM